MNLPSKQTSNKQTRREKRKKRKKAESRSRKKADKRRQTRKESVGFQQATYDRAANRLRIQQLEQSSHFSLLNSLR